MQHYAIVFFPKIDGKVLQEFREKYDPLWNIIPPHVTMVFPFSDIPEQSILEHLDIIAKNLKPFPIHLTGFMKSFDHYLFLLIQEGKEKICKAHDYLYTGILASQLRTDIPFVPHMTLGVFAKENVFDKELYEKALKEADTLNIDIYTNFDSLSLIQGDGISPARIIKTVELDP